MLWQGRGTVRQRLGPTTPVPGVYAAGAHATPGGGLLMAYFPNLDGATVKQILLQTATDRRDAVVTRPGPMGGAVRFGELSATGGILNAEAAVRRALEGR